MSTPAILYAAMRPGASWEDEFNRWYDEEHIPPRMKVPGITGAQRYRDPGTRNHLVVYELETPSVLRTPEYEAVKNNPSDLTTRMLSGVDEFTRSIGEQVFEQARPGRGADALDAPILFSVWFNVPAERVQEFDEWFNGEHIPILLTNADWLWCRRFHVADGNPKPWNRLAMHYLADMSALASPELERARSTPWRARLAQEDWFKGRYTAFQRHGPRHRGTRGRSGHADR